MQLGSLLKMGLSIFVLPEKSAAQFAWEFSKKDRKMNELFSKFFFVKFTIYTVYMNKYFFMYV
jgi:hypothetical protein